MKRNLTLLFYLLLAVNLYSQTPPSCDNVSLKTDEDVKNANPCVVLAAEKLLAQPLNANAEANKEITAFIFAWMDKTHEFTFALGQKMMVFSSEKGNESLLPVYLGCLAKAAVEKKKDFMPDAIKLFAAYVKNPDNKVKQTSKIKKLIKDVDDNKVEKYID